MLTRQICNLCDNEAGVLFEITLKRRVKSLWICHKCYSIIWIVKERGIKQLIKELPFHMPTLAEAERDTIEAVLLQGLNVTDSARALGTTRATLYTKMKEYGIEPEGTGLKGNDRKAG